LALSDIVGSASSPVSAGLVFSFRRSILRAAFFCCFSFRAQAFCRFLKVSIDPPYFQIAGACARSLPNTDLR
jgi:hypothetical protein